ncbi:MAG: DUF2806 domain-containing protein [Mesorhizobium sp.]|nr:MAG: DUF2806 domain-containing protein [Mesorhizobium sp.]
MVCRKASSDNMRRLWGQILAGKIRKPRAFSLRTLRVASELDQNTAEQFRNLAECRLGQRFILNHEASPSTPRMHIKMPAAQPLVSELEAAGLADAGEGMGATMSYPAPPDDRMAIMIGQDVIVFQLRHGERLEFPGFHLTRPGEELAQFVPVNEQRTCEILATHAADQCERITINVPVLDNGRTMASPEVRKVLFDRGNSDE